MTDNFEDQKVLRAEEIVANPEIIGKIRGRYQMIVEGIGLRDPSASPTSQYPHNLNRAIKIMGESGWRVVAFSTDSFSLVKPFWVIVEKIEKV